MEVVRARVGGSGTSDLWKEEKGGLPLPRSKRKGILLFGVEEISREGGGATGKKCGSARGPISNAGRRVEPYEGREKKGSLKKGGASSDTLARNVEKRKAKGR